MWYDMQPPDADGWCELVESCIQETKPSFDCIEWFIRLERDRMARQRADERAREERLEQERIEEERRLQEIARKRAERERLLPVAWLQEGF